MSVEQAGNPGADQAGPGCGAGPLSGVRVLDISTVVAGPFSSTLMADLGAEVLKIELPGEGDHIRQLPPHKDGVALWSKVANRNNRGITLDLRKPEASGFSSACFPGTTCWWKISDLARPTAGGWWWDRWSA